MEGEQQADGRKWRWHDHLAVGLDRVFDAVSTHLRSLLYSPLVEQHLRVGQAYKYSKMEPSDGTEAFLNMVERVQATNLRDGVLKYLETTPALRHLIRGAQTALLLVHRSSLKRYLRAPRCRRTRPTTLARRTSKACRSALGE